MVDTSAKRESVLTPSNMNIYTNLADLKKSEIDVYRYGTLEKNTFSLDGNENILSRNATPENTCYCSEIMSDANGDFATPITMQIDFNTYHTSAGITLVFGDESWASRVKTQYYRDGALIAEQTFEPDAKDYWLRINMVAYYNKIMITFYGTSIPYRFLKIEKILYGAIETFSGEQVMSASTAHNINLLSSELEINTLKFKINDNTRMFSITNKQGYYDDIQTNQRLKVYERKNENEYFLGTYYLTKWSNSNVSTADFTAQDTVGLLDSYTFNGGIYKNKNSGALIDSILAAAGITDYTIEQELTEAELSGYIPLTTCRKALQQVLFAVGGVCDTTGTLTMKIYKPQRDIVQNIVGDKNKLYDTTKVEMNKKVSGIEISLFNYELEEEPTELSKGYLDGTNKIEFGKAVDPSTLVGTNCTIEEAGNNYCIITTDDVETEYTLTGVAYEETEIKKNVSRILMDNIPENILTVTDCKLINESNYEEITARIFDHYNGSYKTTVKILSSNEAVGNLISVGVFNNARLIGNATSVANDLSGGFISTITIDNAIIKAGYEEVYITGQDNLYCGLEEIRGTIL